MAHPNGKHAAPAYFRDRTYQPQDGKALAHVDRVTGWSDFNGSKRRAEPAHRAEKN